MPDPTRKTLSATQVPALFNRSPYATRWMLHQWALGRINLDVGENERMAWGKRLERVILDAAAEELKAEVHDVQQYLTAPGFRIGCTVETLCFHPEWGRGVIEAKNVDWLQWRDNWTETAAPPHIEMQLQIEMLVGNGEQPAAWGAIACLVGGNDLRLYRREFNADFIVEADLEVMQFFADVDADEAPPVAGAAVEVPFINELWPAEERAEPLMLNDEEWSRTLLEYDHARTDRLNAQKVEDAAKAKLLGKCSGYADVRLPGGGGFKITRTPIAAAVIERKAHTRTEIKIIDRPKVADPFEV